jgi:hypothetical protein
MKCAVVSALPVASDDALGARLETYMNAEMTVSKRWDSFAVEYCLQAYMLRIVNSPTIPLWLAQHDSAATV